MEAEVTGDVTRMLTALKSGDDRAADCLFPAVYGELRALAQFALQDERPNHTLQATALVHEAYLKIVDQRMATWRNRAHFFAVAAQAMRRILVDHARTRRRQKRGGGMGAISLCEAGPAIPERDIDLVALDEALNEFASLEPLDARVVEMRFFAGMTDEEIAHVLNFSDRTVRRRWIYAKAWLFRELSKGGSQAQRLKSPFTASEES